MSALKPDFKNQADINTQMNLYLCGFRLSVEIIYPTDKKQDVDTNIQLTNKKLIPVFFFSISLCF